ncbi:MAG: HAD family phosphatase, partial [Angelakisella sp.]|nr:HAD family phosphatase [Angelakisella sp.]
MEARCVLFDFDGVIADTEESNVKYLSKALA